MAGRGKKKRTGADEAGNRRGPGRPPGPPLSEEEKKKRNDVKNIKSTDYRAKKKLERTEFEAFCEMPGINDMFKAFSEEYRKRNEECSKMQFLLKKYEGFCEEPGIIDKFKAFSERCRKRIEECTKKWQELFKRFFEEGGLTEKFKAVCLKVKEQEEGKFNEEFNEEFKKLCEVMENLEIEMIQMGGLEVVTTVNSSHFGAMGTPFEREGKLKRKREEELDGPRQDKRPATVYTTPSRPPIGGFMAEARQNYHQLAAALATQGSLFSTNEGTQIQTREAAHDKEASTSSWAQLKTFTDDELGQGSIELIEELSFLNFLEEDVTNELLDMDTDIFLNLSDLEMSTGNLAGSSNVSSISMVELQSSTTCTKPLTVGAMNSTATGEPHHDPLGMQRGTTSAAGSSGGPSTQSSPHN